MLFSDKVKKYKFFGRFSIFFILLFIISRSVRLGDKFSIFSILLLFKKRFFNLVKYFKPFGTWNRSRSLKFIPSRRGKLLLYSLLFN